MISVAEARQLWVSLYPPGIAYDWSETAVIGGTVLGLARASKQVLLDRIEQLQREVNPSTMIEKIPDWELACGLSNTPIARFGTLDQRRNAVIAVLRTSGSFSRDDIRAIVQPYLLYQDPSQIQISETNRDTLRTANSHTALTALTVPSFSRLLLATTVIDDPVVSRAGAHLLLNLTGAVGDLDFVLTAPDGSRVSFPAGTLPPRTVSTQAYDLVALQFAGKAIRGLWTLLVTTQSAPVTVNSWGVFVEGIGNVYDKAIPPNNTGEGAGAPMFAFVVVVNPVLLGNGYDLQGAQRSLTRWKPAHTNGTLFVLGGV